MTASSAVTAQNPSPGESVPRGNGFRRRDERSYGRLFVMDHFLGRARVDRYFPKWRPGIQERMLESIRHNGEGRAIPLPRIKNLDRDTFLRIYAAQSRPVVFEGAARDWECCRKWSFDWIKQTYGDDGVLLVDHGEVERNPLAQATERTTLRRLIDSTDEGAMKYARFHPLLHKHPELREDINRGWLSEHVTNPRTSWLRIYGLFLGAKGTVTTTHTDGSENFFVEIEGRKKWRFYPSWNTPIFDPDANRSVYKYTNYMPDGPGAECYPMARYMDYYETVLEPGDILYSPPYYWHNVINPDRSIGLSCRWFNVGSALRASPLLAIMEVFNTRPNMIKGLLMSVKDFNEVLVMTRKDRKTAG